RRAAPARARRARRGRASGRDRARRRRRRGHGRGGGASGRRGRGPCRRRHVGAPPAARRCRARRRRARVVSGDPRWRARADREDPRRRKHRQDRPRREDRAPGAPSRRDRPRRPGHGHDDRELPREREPYDAVGHDFAINSPKQLQSLLFEELKLPRGRRTGTGFSTDATVLEELRGAHPVIEKILEYREIEKLRSTYAEGLGGLVDPETRRVHTTFEQTVAATGRLSSRAPNLQNIPIRTPLGRRIRRAFVAGSTDRVLVAADYSQIELRVLAHVSQDPALLDAFRSGADIHRRTAAAGFGVSESAVTREQRDVAKMLNFGIIYGMSDFGLAWRMQMPREEAQRFIDEYFKRYGQVRRYVLETKAFCVEQGYVETLLGRRRYIPDMTS